MQTMRKSLNVVPEIFDLFPDLANGPARLGRLRGEATPHNIQSYRQERQALVDIVVKLSRKPGAFLLMRFNQSTTHAGKGLFSQFVFGDVEAGTDIASKGTIGVESGYTE